MRKPSARQAKSTGFTLLEVMLVLLLIGLLATTVVLNFSGESRAERLDKQSIRFQQLFQFVAETAQLKQQEWGFYTKGERYGFLYYDNKNQKWLAADEPKSLSQYQLPEDISLQLDLDGFAAVEDNLLRDLEWQIDDDNQEDDQQATPVLPQVFILSSGEISPFKLIFIEKSALSPLYATVSTEFSIPLTRTFASEEQP
ncbi:type II secretion system minor pseudopilin GspH [Rheinheimera sp. MMS21-TC3]|uniref:type II secretion system minor pseudopilin GspH n=1 Tax=Rheinheimera sp. MMS21-TC3 TaxID=3072790 RepID=UPI0028C49F87|nr:type II secretion system minor pseudopilin GspH [Rheinheimera sp. MMS21-TC3]WNO59831.1 type II secretion system minor pseudopilin GspH [Rheinheimera sp. MMS21-TC3]